VRVRGHFGATRRKRQSPARARLCSRRRTSRGTPSARRSPRTYTHRSSRTETQARDAICRDKANSLSKFPHRATDQERWKHFTERGELRSKRKQVVFPCFVENDAQKGNGGEKAKRGPPVAVGPARYNAHSCISKVWQSKTQGNSTLRRLCERNEVNDHAVVGGGVHPRRRIISLCSLMPDRKPRMTIRDLSRL